jgi:hypothetical protein
LSVSQIRSVGNAIALLSRNKAVGSLSIDSQQQDPAIVAYRLIIFPGVIAVIITIMVLELKVPHQDGAAGLYAILVILLIYLLSFAFTGSYWINHRM